MNRDTALLADRHHELAKLQDSPGWQALRGEADRIKERRQQALANKLLSGGVATEPANQREIDFTRGFLAGIQAMIDTPHIIETALERALAKETTLRG